MIVVFNQLPLVYGILTTPFIGAVASPAATSAQEIINEIMWKATRG